ncbi:MAG TPA: globin domain-containing protein [Iamia sp.]|jgi:nitric oxide dioxygenase|nr:globin domain-containing protein [Iamia sp.]
MTPDDVATVQATLPDLGPRTDELARAFYTRLFALDPTLRPLFPTDMEAQRQKFVATLGEIVGAISRLDRFTAAAGGLGVAHVTHGAEVHHYELVGEALGWALRTTLGDAWTPAIGHAWAVAYNLVAETMMAAAAQVDP